MLAERSDTINNDIAAAEELKSKAVGAEEAYKQALADARSEAAKIIETSKAEMKSELDAAIAKADVKINEKAEESEKVVSEIRKNALESVEDVAKATALALVAARGGKPEAKTVDEAVAKEMKG